MKRNIISFLLCLLLILPSLGYADEEINLIDASLLADYETGDVIYSNNSKEKIEVASITKVMTYLVAMDQISKGNAKLEDKVTISEKAAKRGGSSFKLKPDQIYSLDRLLESSLIASANDSCIAIAEHISGNEQAFVELMNKKAKELGLEKTNYVSVNGFPEEGVHNTMSVEDIYKLTTHTIDKYPEILKTTSKPLLIDEERGIEFINTNPLLGIVEGLSGFKTGFADDAGYCLISTKETKESQLISIVMGAENQEVRKNKSLELLEGAMSKEFKKIKVIDKNIASDSIEITNSANGKVNIYPMYDQYGMVSDKGEVSKTISIDDDLKFPIIKGESIGDITVTYNGNSKKSRLVAREEIKENTFINESYFKIKDFLEYAF